MAQKIIIVGSGLAGLTAGCYGQMNGFDTEIFEADLQPGGLCTSWRRGEFTFDGCIHRLVGTNPKSPFFRFWQELGAFDTTQIVNQSELARVERDGRTLVFYANLHRLTEHLHQLSPDDRPLINEFASLVRSFQKLEYPVHKPRELFSAWDYLKMLAKTAPIYRDFVKMIRTTTGDFAQSLSDPLLRDAFSLLMPPESTLVGLVSIMASLDQNDAGWPLGGSLSFARAIARRYQALGGKITYQTRVVRILMDHGKAVGVELADGTRRSAQIVISAADGHTTLFDMIEEQYLTPRAKRYFAQLPTFSSVQVSFGVGCDISTRPSNLYSRLARPVWLGGVEHRYIPLRHYCYDTTLSPPGKSIVTSTITSSPGYWQQLRADTQAYGRAMEKIVDVTTRALSDEFPETQNKIEVTDAAPPITYNHYANAWRGIYPHTIATNEAGVVRLPQILSGVQDFYMIGQWTQPPAGLPGSMLTGRHVVQIICRQQKKSFTHECSICG